MKKLSYYYSRLLLRYYRYRSFRGLKNKNFSIISNNCTAGFIYQDAKLEYLTPTIGLFIYAPCYLKLLNDFNLINEPLQFIKISKYPSANKTRRETNNFYPIGLLNGLVEIHFLHYDSAEDAKARWERRLARLNRANIFFIFSDRDLSSPELVEQFLKLPLLNKLCLSAREHYPHSNLVSFRKYRNAEEMPAADEARVELLKSIRFAPLLNNLRQAFYRA